MTDQQNHTDAWGMDLVVHRHYSRSDQMVITTGTDADDDTERYSTTVPTARLIAMIDTIDPDAMRAYLREAVERAVPEVDSPEDTDERPERDVFQWEEPPALTTAEHPATVYFDGLAVMLRARPMAWAKIAENVKTARYIKPMKDRGCEITTRNNDRSTRKGDVYARFVGQR